MEVTLENLLNAVPILQEIDKAFLMSSDGQPDTNDIMRAGQSSIFMELGLENKDLMRQGFKEYNKVLSRQQTGMEAIAREYERGIINTQDAMKRFNALTKDSYLKQFRAGTKAVGNPFYQDMGLTRKDISFISKARRAEAGFFRRFLHDIKDPGHGAPKGTPGARPKRHSYQKRAGYYAKSGKAQFFNGMVAGAGDKLIVLWVLGVPQTEHCDRCPVLASRKYTWRTLPTTPRAGDTPCLFNCYCHLEFRPPKGKKSFGGDPDTGGIKFLDMSQQGVDPIAKTPGGITRKDGKRWNEDSDIIEEHNRIRSGMNKSRQMIEISKGAELKKWLKMRREFNDELQMLQDHFDDLRFLPTHSVADLVKTIQSASRKGGFVAPMSSLGIGDEVMAVRGVTSSSGLIVEVAGKGYAVKTASGEYMFLNEAQDIYLLQSKAVIKPSNSSSFVNASSFKEATEFAKKHFATHVDFEGLTLRQINAINKSVWEWKTQFKWGQDKLKGLYTATAKTIKKYTYLTKEDISNAFARELPDGGMEINVGGNIHNVMTVKGIEIKIKWLKKHVATLEVDRLKMKAMGHNRDEHFGILTKSVNSQIKGLEQRKLLAIKAKAGDGFVKEHSSYNFPDDIESQIRCTVGHEAGHIMEMWFTRETSGLLRTLRNKYGIQNTTELLRKVSPTNRWKYEPVVIDQVSEFMAETFTLFREGHWSVLDKDVIKFWQDMMYDVNTITAVK